MLVYVVVEHKYEEGDCGGVLVESNVIGVYTKEETAQRVTTDINDNPYSADGCWYSAYYETKLVQDD